MCKKKFSNNEVLDTMNWATARKKKTNGREERCWSLWDSMEKPCPQVHLSRASPPPLLSLQRHEQRPAPPPPPVLSTSWPHLKEFRGGPSSPCLSNELRAVFNNVALAGLQAAPEVAFCYSLVGRQIWPRWSARIGSAGFLCFWMLLAFGRAVAPWTPWRTPFSPL